jgi:hypothetical protein
MSFTSLALIKVSFLLFYKAIFVYDKWRFFNIRNVIINLMILIVVIWDLGFTLTFLSACRSNFRAHWATVTAKEITVKCINTFLMMYALSISDFITDVLILLIPIPMIWRLHLPPMRKFGVMIVFLFGGLYVPTMVPLESSLTSSARATLASLIRLIWMRDVIAIGSTPSRHQDPLSIFLNRNQLFCAHTSQLCFPTNSFGM